jgi:hypothetical protein
MPLTRIPVSDTPLAGASFAHLPASGGAPNYTHVYGSGDGLTLQALVGAQHALFDFAGAFIDNLGFVNGQTFTALYSGTITDIQLPLSRVGSPTGNVRLNLHSVNPTMPLNAINTAILATTDSTAMGSVSTVDGTFYTFTFASPPTVVAGTRYAFAYDPTAVTSVDGSNRINIRRTNNPAAGKDYTGGNYGTVGGSGFDLDYNFVVNMMGYA